MYNAQFFCLFAYLGHPLSFVNGSSCSQQLLQKSVGFFFRPKEAKKGEKEKKSPLKAVWSLRKRQYGWCAFTVAGGVIPHPNP